MSNVRRRTHPESIYFSIDETSGFTFLSKSDSNQLEAIRSKHKYNREIYYCSTAFVIKELPSTASSRAASYVEMKVYETVRSLLLPRSQLEEEETILLGGDGSNIPSTVDFQTNQRNLVAFRLFWRTR